MYICIYINKDIALKIRLIYDIAFERGSLGQVIPNPIGILCFSTSYQQSKLDQVISYSLKKEYKTGVQLTANI